MKIFLNTEPLEIAEGFSLAGVLEKKELINKKGIAIAINNEVIPRSNWNTHLIKENDKLLVIQATQGG